MFVLCLILLVNPFGLASIYEIPLPSNYQDCFDEFKSKTDLTKTAGSVINWNCLQRCTPRTKHLKNNLLADANNDWFINLVKEMDPTKSCDPEKVTLRARKEIRQLTKKEREKLFHAFRVLKDTPYGDTNRYEYIASMHSGDLIDAAHFGPNFLPWHRFYTLLMENALRQIEPDVTLPYWDTGLDSFMLLSDLQPTDSVLWTSDLFGNGDGEVITGPFQNWSTATGMLIRNYGRLKDPGFNNFVIEKILTKLHLEDISPLTADVEFDLMSLHGPPHNWVGGQMSGINTAAYEPVFFFYHCFIDFVFEQWQRKAKAAGVDVENEWPANAKGAHVKGSTFGFGSFTNIQGMSNYFTTCVFKYEDQPSCSNGKSCDSEFLSCDTADTDNMTFCRSKSMEEVGKAKEKYSLNNEGIQNTFCINDNCTTENWAFLPVEVVQLRPPGYHSQRSHPVINNHDIDWGHDIYIPEKYPNLIPPASAKNLATSGRCGNEGMQNIQLETTGLNYDGTFYEIAVPDNRLPLSKTTAFIAARKPDHQYTQFLVSAFDSCGRICKIYCRDRLNENEFYQCSGAFEIAPYQPLEYTQTVEESIHNMWKIDKKTCPTMSQKPTYIRVYCGYSDEWIWTNPITNGNAS
ncbi:hypothetical protein KUTeg_019097 [Tegillarca granosa]|uniref:Tyrosinase copper-binding domain-containing protein n=1 Tax=Tegillarca granosa TaxID=220873 RepID=A0ABQ9EE55_TEGGR|nr:hypothetical protein KUTeg_019097 [Tegillarca granosa]